MRLLSDQELAEAGPSSGVNDGDMMLTSEDQAPLEGGQDKMFTIMTFQSDIPGARGSVLTVEEILPEMIAAIPPLPGCAALCLL